MSSEQAPVSPISDESETAALEGRIAELQSLLEQEQGSRKLAEAKIEEMLSESEAQAIVVAGLEDQLLAARRAHEEVETRSREIEERLRASTKERDREKAKRSELQAELAKLDLETISGEELLAERSQLKRQLTEASQRVDQLQQYCDRLKSEREQAQKLEAQGRGEPKGGSTLLSARLIEARGQITELEAEKASLQAAREASTQHLQQLQEQLEEQRRQADREKAESLGRENQLQQEVQRLEQELSEGAFAEMAKRHESLENLLRERDAEAALRAKELEQAARERRRLEDLLKDKDRAVAQLEQQATKLAEKVERSEARRDEAAHELAQTEAAYRAVQAQLEQRFTKPAADQLPSTKPGFSARLATGLGGLVVGVLAVLAGQELGMIPSQPGSSADLPYLVHDRQASDAQVDPGRTDIAPAATTSPPEAVTEEPAPAVSPSLVSTGPRQPSARSSLHTELVEGGVTLVGIPGGFFRMGYDRDALAPDETPVHPVEVPPFYISRDEVTFAEYDRFARATGRPLLHDEGWGRGQRPVINVSWNDAQAYTAWLSGLTGKRYRLPSEAEWEYAARAGTDSFFWWGNILGSNNANCFDCGSQWDNKETAPVGSFAVSPFGLRDTAGNVLEWVADCYHDSYEGAPADGSAWIGGICDARVARGGAFNKPATAMRASRRSSFSADTRLSFIGFRVVREP